MKKITIIIVSITLLVVGYLAGSFIGMPGVDKESTLGDIGKMNRHKQQVVSQEMELLANKLSSDKEFCNSTITSLSMISSRITEFKTYSDMSVEACGDNPALQEIKSKMESLSKFSTNAATRSNDALQAILRILDGDKSANIEELTNNALLSYMLMEKGIEVAKTYVETIDNYLENNKVEDNKYLAYTRDQWAIFSTIDAAINGNKDLMSYWNNKNYQLSEKENSEIFAGLNSSIKDNLKLASNVNSLCLNSINDNSTLNLGASPILNNTESLLLVNNRELLGQISGLKNISNSLNNQINNSILNLVSNSTSANILGFI